MQEWWAGLTGTVQFFYGMATFFSVFFLWQLIGAFMGLDGDSMDLSGDAADAPGDMDFDDVMESSQAFKVLSLRSIVTFFTLFAWGNALYLTEGIPAGKAMWMSTVWGLIGMFAIAGIFYGLGKMTETGTKDLASCEGREGVVYLDIPSGGLGEITTLVSGAIEHVKANSLNGEALPAGTQVRVVKTIGQTLVKVEK